MERKTHTITMNASRSGEKRLKQLLSKFTKQRHLQGDMRDFRRRAEGQFACELVLPESFDDVESSLTRYLSNAGIRGISIDIGEYHAQPKRAVPAQPSKRVENQPVYAEKTQDPVPAQWPPVAYALAELQGCARGQEYKHREEIQAKDEELAAVRRTLVAAQRSGQEPSDNPLTALIHSHIGSVMDKYNDMLEEIFSAYAVLKKQGSLTIAEQINGFCSLAEYVNDSLGTQFGTDADLDAWLQKREQESGPVKDITALQRELDKCLRNKAAYESAAISGASENMLAAMRSFVDEKNIEELEGMINSCLDMKRQQQLCSDVLKAKREYGAQARLRDDAKARRELGCTFPILVEYAKGKSPSLSAYIPNVTGHVEALHKSFAEALGEYATRIAGYGCAAKVEPVDHIALRITISSEDTTTHGTIADLLQHMNSKDLDALGAKVDIAYLERSQ